MDSLNKQKWEDLNLTRDEIRGIGQALQKEEFRNLLGEYVKEINDPENRRQYEDDIIQLEKERGVEVNFIHPNPGYVIKTSLNGKGKAFVNVCSNNNVGIPFSTAESSKGRQGVHWSIPYCLVPPREDLDKKNKICTVYDVIFNPKTLELSKGDIKFKNLVNDTALGAVEESFNVSLDKLNVKFPKMQFKGFKHATVIRKKIKNFQTSDLFDIPNYPYPPINEDRNISSGSTAEKNNSKSYNKNKSNPDVQFTIPNYTIKHCSKIDMGDFTNDRMCKMTATIPNELVLAIDLPLLKCSSDASVDVTEKWLTLISENPAKYKLELNLPYSVDSNKGSAKFDVCKKVLHITLPVKKAFICNSSSNIDASRYDSGVESDNGCGRSNSLSSNEDDDNSKSPTPQNLTKVVNKTDSFDREVNDVQLGVGFLKHNLHYIVPNYTLRFLDGTLILNLLVHNITPESVKYCLLSESSGFHIKCCSIGAGFFPVHYALCLILPQLMQIINKSFTLEVSENNVTAQLKLSRDSDTKLTEYYVGTNQDNVEKCLFSTTAMTAAESNVLEEEYFTVEKEKEIKSANEDHYISESASCMGTNHRQLKPRTSSESHPGEGKRSKTRGILKISRSLSESSVNDFISWSEENNEKPKKTVRFSDVISKQVFRLNSSILGQRKKNQRKTRNKKRAQERRLSESGNESEGDCDYLELNCNKWNNEPESSSCEVSEISDVSDISESDDGQKENISSSLPYSSSKNHKRRGKKSARKNAATAKLNYLEY